MQQTWIRTKTGKSFWPLKPTPEMVDIEDIAHALSHQCRFSGHTSQFYSVAQHSVHVSELIRKRYNNPQMELAALLHDASEAYLVDVPSPVKRVMPTYKDAEHLVMAAISKKFGLKNFDKEIKQADMDALATEARDLMGNPQGWAGLDGCVADETILQPWPATLAKDLFLHKFKQLTEGRYNERQRDTIA